MRNFENYILNSQFVIDKDTYLTIVIGQITIYAILMTFYQFIASFQGSVPKYLEINLIKYFVKKKLEIYNRIILNPLFEIFFLLEILYKPVITISGNTISGKLRTFLNFIWYVYAVFFFLVFALVVLRCIKCILSIETVTDRNRIELLIRSINRDFERKTFLRVLKKPSIEMLKDAFDDLGCTIAVDNASEWQKAYFGLINNIFRKYENIRKMELETVSTKNKRVNKQSAWRYNMDEECCLLSEIMDGKYIQINQLLAKSIQDLHLRLLKLNLDRALDAGYEKIVIDIFNFNNADLFDCKEWKSLTLKLFEKDNLQNKKGMIETLHRGFYSDNKLFKEYCEKNLRCIMEQFMRVMFDDSGQQKDFVYIFESVLSCDEKLNKVYAYKLCDYLISSNNKDGIDLIKLLKEENCTYIFVYLMLHYSIYKSQFDWENINITVLKELIRRGKSLEHEFERINGMISNSRLEHRYSKDMYRALVENLNAEITGKWLTEIYQQKSIDAFYMTIIKLCVLGQTYSSAGQEGDIEAKILFIDEVAEHKEVLAIDNVKKMILQMQYDDFHKLKYLPKKLYITLRKLLLIDMHISNELIEDGISYIYYSIIGQYLLIKYAGEGDIGEIKKELIRKAYVESNMSIQEYVEDLDSECRICGMELNYVKREKMKAYLSEVMW